MAEKQDSSKTSYNEERNTDPGKQTGNINSRNNNVDADATDTTEVNVNRVGNEGIGDAAANDEKLSNFTSNHSQDA